MKHSKYLTASSLEKEEKIEIYNAERTRKNISYIRWTPWLECD